MNPRRFDWVAAGAAFVAAGLLGMVVAEGNLLPDEVAFGATFFLYFAGLASWRWRVQQHQPVLTTGEMAADRIAELEQRVTELEAAQARVAELEDRLDFTERMLARHPPAQLGSAKEDG